MNKEMQDKIEKLVIERVEEELDRIDMQDRYDDMLDEIYSFDSVGGRFKHMLPSRVLNKCDEVAYRCGFNDFIDCEERNNSIEEVNDNYYDKYDVERIRDEVKAEVESEEEGEE